MQHILLFVPLNTNRNYDSRKGQGTQQLAIDETLWLHNLGWVKALDGCSHCTLLAVHCPATEVRPSVPQWISPVKSQRWKPGNFGSFLVASQNLWKKKLKFSAQGMQNNSAICVCVCVIFILKWCVSDSWFAQKKQREQQDHECDEGEWCKGPIFEGGLCRCFRKFGQPVEIGSFSWLRLVL